VIVELQEYGSCVIALPDRAARRVAELARRAVDVVPDREPGDWRLTARGQVGSIAVDEVQILIRPKIQPENLFLFLEAGLPPRAWRAEAFDYAHRPDLLPVMVSFFARTVETTLASGLLRSYRERHEKLVALRGRIDFATQLSRAAFASPVACRYDDYTADIEENRYLRAAIRLALRAPRTPAVDRHRLLRAMSAMEDVADAPMPADALDRMKQTRLNGYYWPALHLARLLLENLTLVDVRGTHAASAFLLDMDKLFERFVTHRLATALRGRLEIRAQSRSSLDRAGRIVLIPDLLFTRHGEKVVVGDIKYKLTEGAQARREDYYQLLAYTTAYELPEGVLIYCRAPDDEVVSSASVRHGGPTLHTWAVDASGPAERVTAEITALANWLASRRRFGLVQLQGEARCQPPSTIGPFVGRPSEDHGRGESIHR